MQLEEVVSVWCYRGYRPGIVKAIGKRKTLIAWADDKKEWVENKRIHVPADLKERSRTERILKEEQAILGAEENETTM